MTEIIVAAHQPNFFPYLGFFDKLKKADIDDPAPVAR